MLSCQLLQSSTAVAATATDVLSAGMFVALVIAVASTASTVERADVYVDIGRDFKTWCAGLLQN